MFIHRIEGFDTAKFAYGTSGAKQITVSFYVKSSLTGDFSFAVQTGGRNYVNEYTINSANTWERKSFTLPVLTDGTHHTTTSAGLSIIWDLGSGDDYATSTLGSWVTSSNLYRSTGSARLSTNASATWQITGIQVEEGTIVTDFEHRSYAQELALCQRYYYLHARYAMAGGNTGNVVVTDYGTQYSSSVVFTSFKHPVEMRAKHSMDCSTVSNGFIKYAAGTNAAFNSFTLDGITSRANAAVNVSISGTAGHAVMLRTNDVSGAFLAFSAEL